jgi:hypothetical protein
MRQLEKPLPALFVVAGIAATPVSMLITGVVMR